MALGLEGKRVGRLRVFGRVLAATAMASLFLAGCTSSAMKFAPASAQTPFQTPGHQTQTAAGAPDYGLAQDASMPITIAAPQLDARHNYTLPELIDIAQLSNPVTRASWERARQAALAIGVTEAAYLPSLSANVLAGVQQTSTTAPGINGALIQVPPGTLTTTGGQVVPAVTVQWLLFDFGGRDAANAAAKDLSYAANVTFNGTHQKLIFDVSSAYFSLSSARVQLQIARETLANSQTVLSAAEARLKTGVATTIEVAQAKQAVAQAQFGLTQSQGHERSAYLALLQAMGVSPTIKIRVQDASGRRLPRAVPQDLNRLIEASLQRRPDVQAAFAKFRADQKGIAAARAEFLPKVALTGSVNRLIGSFEVDDSRFGEVAHLSANQPNANLLVGITMPIFDGGLRDARLQAAMAQAAASEQDLAALQNSAAQQIVVAYDLLRTSLSGYAAATELTNAAQTTYDAALDYYKNGLGTLADVSVAQTGLLQARLSKATAHSDSLVAAATIAFATGTLTNRSSPGAL
ncbi:TolC family protein [Paradevosia shaoguanensis]|uniref:TolC family protein n=1 Tax=Paradevosia shaoguanensis TaxID=1335043 RepID=UPI00193399F8|nr:TolC family protein [Paradevosia shaoguanensis]